MKTVPLAARVRSEHGSRACRKLRASGEVPANLYGTALVEGKQQPFNQPLAVSAYEMIQLLDRHATVLEVTYEGKQELVQLTEVQRDALGDNIVHVDLLLIDPNKPIHSTVTITIKGDAKGLRTGGVLEVILHELDIEALPRDMPREITVRIDDLDIGDAIHVGDLQLEEGVKPLADGQQVVVHIVEQQEEEEEPEAVEPVEGGAEPEVIAKGKKDEEGAE